MKRYFWNILIWGDQGLNTVLAPVLNRYYKPDPMHEFGSPDETISSVIGKNRTRNPKFIRADKFLDRFEKDHTQKSIEWDE